MNAALCIRELIAAQEFLGTRVKAWLQNIRVNTERVTMPNIHLCVCERGTALVANTENSDVQSEWNSFFDKALRGVRADIRAIELVVHKIRTDR
jgi:hypothetical protein